MHCMRFRTWAIMTANNHLYVVALSNVYPILIPNRSYSGFHLNKFVR